MTRVYSLEAMTGESLTGIRKLTSELPEAVDHNSTVIGLTDNARCAAGEVEVMNELRNAELVLAVGACEPSIASARNVAALAARGSISIGDVLQEMLPPGICERDCGSRLPFVDLARGVVSPVPGSSVAADVAPPVGLGCSPLSIDEFCRMAADVRRRLPRLGDPCPPVLALCDLSEECFRGEPGIHEVPKLRPMCRPRWRELLG